MNIRLQKTVLVLTLATLGGACMAQSPNPDPAHAAEIEEWFKGRIGRLEAPDGYLSLVGLFRLPEGTHRFGSSDDNDLVFPANVPGHAGTLVNEKGRVTLTVADGVDMTVDDEPITKVRLATDLEDDTTVVAMDTFRFYAIDRPGGLMLRLIDHDSEVRKNFKSIDRFPVDPTWRVSATLELHDPPKVIEVPNVQGYVSHEEVPGTLVFEIDGTECRLDPTVSGGRLFIVFADATTGDTTYGGGRFLYADIPEEGDDVVLDFNKAYNPPCVFTPYATCPLPSEGNTVSVAIPAGEKTYHGYDH